MDKKVIEMAMSSVIYNLSCELVGPLKTSNENMILTSCMDERGA